MPKLEDVVKLQLEFLDDLLRELGDVKVVLIGHSYVHALSSRR